MEPTSGFLWSQKSLDESRWITKPRSSDKTAESSTSYASFGDNGTTVSVNSYGHIMQISRYFGYGSSGFFCADLNTHWGPYYVQRRMDQIIEASKIPNVGFRLEFINWTSDMTAPSMGFMYDRWPRFIYRKEGKGKPQQGNAQPIVEESKKGEDAENNTTATNGPAPEQKERKEDREKGSTADESLETKPFAFSIQYFCYEDTVVQQYHINVGEDEIPLDDMNTSGIPIEPPICIRDLDFLADNNTFNNEPDKWNPSQLQTSVVANNSLVIVHPFLDEMRHRNHSENPDEKQSPVAVALIVTPFIGDRLATINDDKCITIENLKESTQLEITITYKLILLTDESLKSLNLQSDTVPDNRNRSVLSSSLEEHAVIDSSEVDSERAKNGSSSAEVDEASGEVTQFGNSDKDKVTQENREDDGEADPRNGQQPGDNYEQPGTPSNRAGNEDEERQIIRTHEAEDEHEKAAVVPDIRDKRAPTVTIDIGPVDDIDSTNVQPDVKEDEASTWINQCVLARKQMENVFVDYYGYRKICFSKNAQLDFIFRRNLEHILSVCSIPIEHGISETPEPPAPPPVSYALLPMTAPASRRASIAASTVSLTPTQNRRAIAITCGDISGHRIGPRASLSAVQFLSTILKYLETKDVKTLRLLYSFVKVDPEPSKRPAIREQKNDPEGAKEEEASKVSDSAKRYLRNLRNRIREVLLGHINWICLRAEKLENGSFSAHYWPSGASINKKTPAPDLEWLPPPSILDTPLQLLKISSCYKLSLWEENEEDIAEQIGTSRWVGNQNEEELSKMIRTELQNNVGSWIRELHALNERGTYAFFREAKPDEDDVVELKYCLTDHVMICLALEFVKNVGVKVEEEFARYYTYHEVRRKVLKRFTTENPMSKQRMLATTRWQDETRFLFHSKDAFLLDAAEKYNFFTKSKDGTASSGRKGKSQDINRIADPWNYADDLWIKLVDAQAYYNKYRYLEWSKPLWYALVLALGLKGRRVNSDSSKALIEKT